MVVVIPENQRASIGNILKDSSFSTEVETYARFGKRLLQRVSKENLILLCSKKDYDNIAPDPEEMAGILSGPGKLLLQADENGIGNSPIPMHRNVDLIHEGAGKELLHFKINRLLSDIDYDSKFHATKKEVDKLEEDLQALNEIGMALSTEKDLGMLLDLIVSRSRQMTWADAGSLYLIEADPNITEDSDDYFSNKKMRFQVAQNDSRQVPFKSFVVEINKSSIYGYVGLTQEALSFADVYHLPKDVDYTWGGKEFDATIGYRTMSMLAVPMINWRGETIGVIQLINRKINAEIILEDPKTCIEFIQPFTMHDMRMAMSIASQASIAIQNTQLVDSIRTLFDGFIDASVKAIESRDPTTAGHSQRVAQLSVALAEQVDHSKIPLFKNRKFNREQLQELHYASLLHDFGKIGVREHVLIKAKKLYPHELRSVEDRFELIHTLTALNHSQQKNKALNMNMDDQKALIETTDRSLEAELTELQEWLEFIVQCNEPTVLAQGGFERLAEVGEKNYKTMSGREFPFLTEREQVSLSVPRGSLTQQDRKEIESHVTHTYRFLATIPWTSDLRNVPDIAYAHHEKLDGTGYPNRLKSDKIPIQSKMMTIADIFDALTASDRPYKKALPAERALNILQEEANSGHVDSDLLELFISSGIYNEVLVNT